MGKAKPDEGLVDAARSGDRRRALVALRDRLAVEVEREVVSGYCSECRRGSSGVPSLAKQLADVLKQIELMDEDAEEADGVDELARRRDARRTEDPPRAAGDK